VPSTCVRVMDLETGAHDVALGEEGELVVQPSAAYKDRYPEELKQAILAFARQNFSPYKVPQIIEVVPSLPLNTVGKVDKKALR
jgi:long-chain acyl-CoA synthetase